MKTSHKLIYWSPRILCIISILFISMFAMDAFAPELTFKQQLTAFFIHLIPSFVLIAALILAWKKELIGGILFLLIGIGLSPLIFMHNYKMNHSIAMSLGIILIITFPFIVTGILFILSSNLQKRVQQQAS